MRPIVLTILLVAASGCGVKSDSTSAGDSSSPAPKAAPISSTDSVTMLISAVRKLSDIINSKVQLRACNDLSSLVVRASDSLKSFGNGAMVECGKLKTEEAVLSLRTFQCENDSCVISAGLYRYREGWRVVAEMSRTRKEGQPKLIEIRFSGQVIFD